METKKFIFGNRELPSYLGYGTLDEKSIKYENDTITANYVLNYDGSIVHRVNWDKTRCELKTEIHGESCETNLYPNLNKALTTGFLFRDFVKDKVYYFLLKRTSGMGNIYVQKPEPKGLGQKRVIHYPAGLLMSFRLPLLERTQQYAAFLESIKRSNQITFFREHKSILLLTDTELEVTIQPLVIVEFIVPLAYMTSAAKTFDESGIINPSKQYRLMIAESYQAETTQMQSFIGNEKLPFFAICFAEYSEETHPYLKKLFIESIKGLKDKLIQKENETTSKDNQSPSDDNGFFNEETGEWEGVDYPEPPQRVKESWVSVTKDLTTKELETPYNDDSLLLWIHKLFNYKHCDGFWMFKYELFSPDLHPMQLKEGNFTCISISDFTQSIGCGNYTTIKYEISDNTNRVVSFRGGAQMENGVIEAIQFIRSLNRFNDWKDYYEKQVPDKSRGRTDEELDK